MPIMRPSMVHTLDSKTLFRVLNILSTAAASSILRTMNRLPTNSDPGVDIIYSKILSGILWKVLLIKIYFLEVVALLLQHNVLHWYMRV